MKSGFLFFPLVHWLPLLANAQEVLESSQANITSPLQLSGYLETYYIQDFNNPNNHRRPEFVYSHNVTDSPSINLAMLKATFATDRIRGNLALGSGSYMRANYAAEAHGLRNLYEANIGIKLSQQNNL